jgi:hypothetical protein
VLLFSSLAGLQLVNGSSAKTTARGCASAVWHVVSSRCELSFENQEDFYWLSCAGVSHKSLDAWIIEFVC